VNLVIQWLLGGVSDESTANQPETLMEVLAVKRNATVGLGVGAGVAVLAYVVRVFEVFGPAATGRSYPIVGPEGWFLLLAVVFASATALLVTILLTAVRIARVAGDQ